MKSPLFSVEGLTKRFRERLLLDSAGLAFEAGSGYVLTGANGAGKTTLLRIIAGLEPAESGRLAFKTQAASVSDYPESWRSEIVYVHQQPYLFHTTVEKNLAYGLARRGFTHAERHALVDQALMWAGLAGRREVPPHKLSGGETQRAALARAKLLDPTLLLLDEPTANLDGGARRRVLELVTALCVENHTVVVASHDPEIMRLAILNRLRISDRRIQLDD